MAGLRRIDVKIAAPVTLCHGRTWPGPDTGATMVPLVSYFKAYAACAGHDDEGVPSIRLNLPAVCCRLWARGTRADRWRSRCGGGGGWGGAGPGGVSRRG